MAVEKEFFAVIIEDVRARHAAVGDLIKNIDQQAISLLSFYPSIAIAAVSGAAAIIISVPSVPPLVGYGLAAAALCFVAGSMSCFMVLRTAIINLPGQDAAFWRWATHPKLTELQVVQAYLEAIASREAMNNAVCARGSRWLAIARMFGVLAPVAAAVTMLAAYRPG